MFRKMPLVLMLIIAGVILLNPFIPDPIKQILYGISLTIKSLIIFLLPFIIFGLLFKTMIHLSNSASKVILLILACVCAANFISTFLSHYMGELAYHLDLSLIQPHGTKELLPQWSFQFPRLIANDKAMLGGILLGILLGKLNSPFVHEVADKLDRLVLKLLDSFAYLIPLFITGFVIKLHYDGVMQIIFRDYTTIFALIGISLLVYIGFLYAVLNRFNLSNTWRCIKNLLPAALAGFSTMSSAAAMPLTIAGAQSNAHHKDLARSIIPATVNIHLLGDCFAIPIFAYAIMKSYGMAEPSLYSYFIFVCYFVAAKFSVAAVPGGGVLVMLPILESCFGFTAEMLSLMTAIYVLFDPFITSMNVLGNGLLAKLIDAIASIKLVKLNLASDS